MVEGRGARAVATRRTSTTPRYKRHLSYMEPSDREEKKKKQPWYKGHGLKFSGGDKASRLAQFSKRLYEFKGFLELVESKHPGLEEDEKDSHSGIKVGRHFGMLENADKVEIYNNMGQAPELAWSGDGSEATREKLKEELTNLSA